MSSEDDYFEHARREMFPKLKGSALSITILNGEPRAPGVRVSEAPCITKGTPKSYRYAVRWDRLRRKGQQCVILTLRDTLARVRFDDGFEAMISRGALRRVPAKS